MTTYEFDAATRVQPIDGGVYASEIHDGWDIHGNANGGYLLALAVQAMRAACGRPDPVTVTAHYLSPGKAGPAETITEVLKSGRRFATVSGSLRQGGREVIRVLGTFGDLAGAHPDEPRLIRAEPPDLPPFEVARSRELADDAPSLMGKVDVRLHPDDDKFATGRPSGSPVQRGWFGFADGRDIDPLSLLLACDAFPPTVFNLELEPGWVPTLELTVHLRAVPSPGPVRCLFETRFLQNGFFEEDGEVWDSEGRLVAQSRQLALTPLRPPTS
ncbi:MAG: thioesterase family protein [Ilumatobacteraceae bacterium]